MHDRPVRILHIVGGMNRGGVETWLMSVLRNINRERFQMEFLVHTMRECTYDDEIHELGSRTIPCMHPSRPWAYATRFRRILNEFGPYDVVHSHVYWFSGCAARLSYQAGVPRRLVHMYPHEDLRARTVLRRLYRWVMCRWISRYATGILADSQIALSAFNRNCRRSRQPQAVVYPVVDLSSFIGLRVDRAEVRNKYGLPRDLPIVSYVARFYPHKNHRCLLEVARQVNAHHKLAHFVLAGACGPSLPELQEAVRERNDVSVLPDIKDVSELMGASDVFVFPSLNEGFGIVALEAQAAGLPVVATDLPSIREVLAPTLRALTFEPDAPHVAASNIMAVLSDTSLHDRLVRDGYRWVQNFDLRSSMAKLVSLYTT